MLEREALPVIRALEALAGRVSCPEAESAIGRAIAELAMAQTVEREWQCRRREAAAVSGRVPDGCQEPEAVHQWLLRWLGAEAAAHAHDAVRLVDVLPAGLVERCAVWLAFERDWRRQFPGQPVPAPGDRIAAWASRKPSIPVPAGARVVQSNPGFKEPAHG